MKETEIERLLAQTEIDQLLPQLRENFSQFMALSEKPSARWDQDDKRLARAAVNAIVAIVGWDIGQRFESPQGVN